MKSLFPLLLAFLIILSGCSGPAAVETGALPEPLPAAVETGALPEPLPAPVPPALSSFFDLPEILSPGSAAHLAAVAKIASKLENCTPREAVLAYLELQYIGYLNLRQVNLGRVLDTRYLNMYNLNIWQNRLTQRRRLLRETGLCYVNTVRKPYTVRFLEPYELNDPRLEFWQSHDFQDNADYTLHFVVEGKPGEAYPPLMCVNGEQSVRLRRNGDGWLITFVYFPGAVRGFYNKELMAPRDDAEVCAELLEEFFVPGEEAVPEDPAPEAGRYNGQTAADYARMYAEEANPAFYHIGDWKGNCMNFVSQCVLYGFGGGDISGPVPWDYMNNDWFAGEGGGSSSWENVDYFWNFATKGGYMRSQTLDAIGLAHSGDVIQIRSEYISESDDENNFTHSFLLVDEDTMLLAQNSPSNFTCYSDLINVKTRMIRPLSVPAG